VVVGVVQQQRVDAVESEPIEAGLERLVGGLRALA